MASFITLAVALLPVLFLGSWESFGDEISAASPATSRLQETNSQYLLQVSLQLQEQLCATLLAIGRTSQEAKDAAAQNAQVLSKGLGAIEQTLSAHHARDLEAMQRSNRVMLIVVGVFAAMSFLAMFMLTCFQWRMSRGLGEISAALAAALGNGPDSAAATLGLVQESQLRLPGTTEQPEKRTHGTDPNSHLASESRAGPNMPIENRSSPGPGEAVRRRHIPARRMELVLGLICAAMLALLLGVMAHLH